MRHHQRRVGIAAGAGWIESLSGERTAFVALSELTGESEARTHCLELLNGGNAGQRYVVSGDGLAIGRVPPVGILLAESEVSRVHCRLTLEHGRLIATDLGSTNGTYVDGVRIAMPTIVPVGGVIRIGTRLLKHELLTGSQIRKSAEIDRDLAAASAYVEALLPPPITDGPVQVEWSYSPSARLGGDAFGYMFLDERRFVFGLIDVSGHGAGAALHSVAVVNVLRKRALPGVDMADPGAVLSALNDMFQMDSHADMYFTMWYGVYDLAARRLDYAAGGHHPAFLLAGGEPPAPLGIRGPMLGAIPGRRYRTASATLPADATLYVFSDGVFEIVTNTGQEWQLDDFVALLPAPRGSLGGESAQLLRQVRATARGGELDDDFSLVILRLP